MMPIHLNNANPGAVASGAVVAARPATLFGFSVYNGNAALRYVQLHDSATAASESAVPVMTFTVGPGQSVAVSYGAEGRRFANGIYICNSTTAATKTLGSADSLIDAQWV